MRFLLRVFIGILLMSLCGVSGAQTKPDTIRVCFGADTVLSNLRVEQDGQHFVWMEKKDTGWTTLCDTVSDEYVLEKVEDSVRIRCVIKINADAVDLKEYHVIPYAQLVSGEIRLYGKDSVCPGTDPGNVIVYSPASGGDGIFIWQKSTDGSNWENVMDSFPMECEIGNIDSTTYFRVWTGCGVASDTISVYVYDSLKVEMRGIDDTICYHTSMPELSCIPNDGGGNYSYRWQESKDGSNWNYASGVYTDSVYKGVILDSTRYFRVKVQSICGQLVSDSVKITVHPKFEPGVIVGGDTVCSGRSPNGITFEKNPSGGGGKYGFQWEQSDDGVSYVLASNATDTIFLPANPKKTMYFRVKVTDKLCSVEKKTNEVVVYVPDKMKPATIYAQGKNTICFGADAGMLYVYAPAIGGKGIISNQWQCSVAGSTWIDVPRADSVVYYPGKLKQNTSFRLKSVSECDSVFSGTITFYVYDSLVPAVIQSSKTTTLCYGDTGGVLSIKSQAEGGNGNFTYQWHRVYDAGWLPVLGATESQFMPGVLYETAAFAVTCVSSAGCGSVKSNVITLNVYPELIAGKIGKDTQLCFHTMPPLWTCSPKGGSGIYEYLWQSSHDNHTWSTVSGSSNNSSFQDKALDTISFYRVVVNASGCSDTSGVVKVEVLPRLNPEISGGDTQICYHSKAPILKCNQSSDNYMFQWQYSLDTSKKLWEIAASDSNVYEDGLLDSSRYYRVIVNTSHGCSDTSNPVKVTVLPKFDVGDIGNDATICYGTVPDSSIGLLSPKQVYCQWEMSTDSIYYELLKDETGVQYKFNNKLDCNHYYRMVAKSSEGCYDTTNVVKITVLPKMVPGSIAGNQALCSIKDADTIKMVAQATGSSGRYGFQWEYSEDTLNWIVVNGADDTVLLPTINNPVVYYRLVFSDTFCQENAASNMVRVRISQLPDSVVIHGKTSVCYNQYETYYVEKCGHGVHYEWDLSGKNGSIIPISKENDTIEVYWFSPGATDSLFFKVSVPDAECERTSVQRIGILDMRSPSVTEIRRKPNSNIWVAKEDDRNIFFQWGYTTKNIGRDSVLKEGMGVRYVQINSFDAENNIYWLKMYPDSSCPCHSFQVFGQETAVSNIKSEDNLVRVVTALSDAFTVHISNPNNEPVNIRLISPTGQIIYQRSLGDGNLIVHNAPVSVNAGFYLIQVRIGNNVYVKKTVIL